MQKSLSLARFQLQVVALILAILCVLPLSACKQADLSFLKDNQLEGKFLNPEVIENRVRTNQIDPKTGETVAIENYEGFLPESDDESSPQSEVTSGLNIPSTGGQNSDDASAEIGWTMRHVKVDPSLSKDKKENRASLWSSEYSIDLLPISSSQPFVSRPYGPQALRGAVIFLDAGLLEDEADVTLSLTQKSMKISEIYEDLAKLTAYQLEALGARVYILNQENGLSGAYARVFEAAELLLREEKDAYLKWKANWQSGAQAPEQETALSTTQTTQHTSGVITEQVKDPANAKSGANLIAQNTEGKAEETEATYVSSDPLDPASLATLDRAIDNAKTIVLRASDVAQVVQSPRGIAQGLGTSEEARQLLDYLSGVQHAVYLKLAFRPDAGPRSQRGFGLEYVSNESARLNDEGVRKYYRRDQNPAYQPSYPTYQRYDDASRQRLAQLLSDQLQLLVPLLAPDQYTPSQSPLFADHVAYSLFSYKNTKTFAAVEGDTLEGRFLNGAVMRLWLGNLKNERDIELLLDETERYQLSKAVTLALYQYFCSEK